MQINFNDYLLEHLGELGLLQKSPGPNFPQENFELADGLSDDQIREVVRKLCDHLQDLYQIEQDRYANTYGGRPMV